MTKIVKRSSGPASAIVLPKKKFTAWSYSRYSDYVKCAFYAYLKHLVKLWPEPPGPALARGSAVDSLCTQYADGTLKRCPPELRAFKGEFDALRKRSRELALQQDLAFTRSWERCDTKDWDRAWVRIKMDCSYVDGDVLKIIDFKTGKIYPDNVTQLDLYAVGGVLTAPAHVTRIEAELWYLDAPPPENIIATSYTLEEARELQRDWEKRTKAMLSDGKFQPAPSDHACRYCYFGQKAKADRGGPGICKF